MQDRKKINIGASDFGLYENERQDLAPEVYSPLFTMASLNLAIPHIMDRLGVSWEVAYQITEEQNKVVERRNATRWHNQNKKKEKK